MKVCCITGHRPKNLPWGYGKDCAEYDEYYESLYYIVSTLIEEGYTAFISGMALGVDLDFAELIIHLREEYELPITLECALPCENQTFRWSEGMKALYNSILEKANKVTLVSKGYNPGVMQKRNEYMVDHSDCVIAVWNGIESGGTWNTVSYARTKNKRIETINV